MPSLLAPTVEVWASFREAMGEVTAEGRGGPLDGSTIGIELPERPTHWSTADGFAAYVAGVRADALEETPRRDGWVPCTTWWWLEGGT